MTRGQLDDVDLAVVGPFVDGDLVFEGLQTDLLDPGTGEYVVSVVAADKDVIDLAVDAAARASRTYARSSGAERARQLRALAAAVRDDIDRLAIGLTHEQGKPLTESRLEINRFCMNLEYFSGLATLPDGVVASRLAPGTRGDTVQHPYGVCAAILPFNFPIGLLGNKLGPALATGNCLIVKPAETTPVTTVRIAEIAATSLPRGVFQVVTGGPEVGRDLVRHPRVGKVTFTGSRDTGRAVMADAASHPKPVSLELGGSDPMVVVADADVEAAAKGATTSRYFNCGQVCVATKRVYVMEQIAESFTKAVVDRVRRLHVGHGTGPVHLGPVHTASGVQRLHDQLANALTAGAKVCTGGSRIDGPGHFFTPTVLAHPPVESRVLTEEVFGPILPIVAVVGVEEAVALASSADFALGASVWSADVHRARGIAEALPGGYAWINATERVHRELPFGGHGPSGFGVEHGVASLAEYTRTKTVVFPEAVAC